MFSANTIRKQDARKAQNRSSVCPDGSRMQMLFEKMRKEQDSMLLQGMIWDKRSIQLLALDLSVQLEPA